MTFSAHPGVHSGFAHAVEGAADVLSDAGYAVERVELPRFGDALECYNALINTEFGLAWPRIRRLLTDDSARHLEVSMRRQPPSDLAGYIAATGTRHGIVCEWMQFQVSYPLLLGPVSTEPAADPVSLSFHDAMEAPVRLCTATSFVGVPAVSLATGLADGLPAAVQIIGQHYREDLCLAAAATVEEVYKILSPIDPRSSKRSER